MPELQEKTNALLTPLLQAVEVWMPDKQQGKLTWSTGFYSAEDEFAQKSRTLCFDRGEGVPGKAWQTYLPVISRDLPDDDFLRGEAAARVGVDCAVAVPVMKGEECRGVINFLSCQGESLQGAFEVWSRNDRDELGISASYYANLQRFGAISQHVRFPRRAGLPGETWAEREPKIISRLGLAKNFMRAAGARADNLSTAIAWPLLRGSRELDAVFMMLSAVKSPIASVMEIWKPCEESGKFQIAQASYGPYIDLEATSKKMECGAGEGLVGRALAEETASVTTDFGTEPVRGEKLTSYGFKWSLSLPVFVGEQLSSVVVLMQ